MAPLGAKTRVLVVDDSPVVRVTLERELSRRGLEVVGTASNPYRARDLLVRLRPDIMTLDVEMPRMDGLTFLKRVMSHFPTPAVILSSLTPANGPMAIEAMEMGAVEVFQKPSSGVKSEEGSQLLDRLAAVLKAAGGRPVRKAKRPKVEQAVKPEGLTRTTDKVIALGASTGGTTALMEILTSMPADAPGIVVVQHMPPLYTASFASRLNMHSRLWVKEADDGEWVENGKALIAPGNFHMAVERSGGHYRVRVKNGPMVHHVRPAVDVLFKSLAVAAGPDAVAALLTGMGKDGAQGLLTIRDAGGVCLAQDEATSVVWGMPQEAVVIGAAKRQVPLDEMAASLIRECRRLELETLKESSA